MDSNRRMTRNKGRNIPDSIVNSFRKSNPATQCRFQVLLDSVVDFIKNEATCLRIEEIGENVKDVPFFLAFADP